MASCLKSLVVLLVIYHSSYASTKYCPTTAGQTCDCDGDSKCKNDNVNCIDDVDCYVYCNGYEACYEARITCPNNADCIVECASGWHVCSGTGTKPFTIDYNNAKSFKCEGSYCPSAYPPYTANPTLNPTPSPAYIPTTKTSSPTRRPTFTPTTRPTKSPTETTPSPTTPGPPPSPTYHPTSSPTKYPTKSPSPVPTNFPTKSPTYNPSISPTKYPTKTPTISPTKYPTKSPTTPSPTLVINSNPTSSPSTPTKYPTPEPSNSPTLSTESITLLSTSPLSILAIVTAVVFVVTFLFMCGFCIWRKILSNQFKYSKDFTEPLLVETAGNIFHNEHNIEQNYTHTDTANPTKQYIKSKDNDIVNSINKLDETSTGIFTSTSRDDNITNGGDIELLDYVNKTKTLELIQNDPHSDEMNKCVGNNNEQTEIGNAIGERTDEKKDDENNNAEDLVTNVHIYEEKNEPESSECVVCMDKATQYACIPCGHHCLCETCKDMIDNKCPICMTTCTVFKIFK